MVRINKALLGSLALKLELRGFCNSVQFGRKVKYVYQEKSHSENSLPTQPKTREEKRALVYNMTNSKKKKTHNLNKY